MKHKLKAGSTLRLLEQGRPLGSPKPDKELAAAVRKAEHALVNAIQNANTAGLTVIWPGHPSIKIFRDIEK